MTPTPEDVPSLIQYLDEEVAAILGPEGADYTEEPVKIYAECSAALTALQARAEAAEARVRELEAVLAYYASDAAWTVDQVEGPYGDYGSKARAAITPPPGDSQ